MRLFTAIDIPVDVKAQLVALIDRLRSLPDLRWIPLEKLHITTKFIGEWPEARLDELKQALATIKSPGPVEIVIRGLGRLPRVLYAEVETGAALATLAASTERVLESIGVAAETRPYRPHVTLARTRNAVFRLEIADAEIGSYRASSFALYLSAGGKYTKLQEFSFSS